MSFVILLCGVPASGKSWVADQVKHKFNYLPHDLFQGNSLIERAVEESKKSKPVLIDCPFNERDLRHRLESKGLNVRPVFIVEQPRTIRERYFKREGRVPLQNILTRADTIKSKVHEWRAQHGNSDQILSYLLNLEV